jgi:hypothetical protein
MVSGEFSPVSDGWAVRLTEPGLGVMEMADKQTINASESIAWLALRDAAYI